MGAEFHELKGYAIPGLPAVHGIGIGAKRVTYQSQQRRAFNLGYLLEQTGQIRRGSTVAVVGGGLSGLTAAAALCWRGCKVTLFERAPRACHIFEKNVKRPIYPSLFRWPFPEATDTRTDLPFLNWKQGTPESVIQEAAADWPTRNFPERCYGMNVVRIGHNARGKPYILARRVGKGNGPLVDERVFDVVVLAVGFGAEKKVKGIISPGYWELDNLEQDHVQGSSSFRCLISGMGDGGIMDLLRCLIHDFSFGSLLNLGGLLVPDFMDCVARIEAGAPDDRFDAASYFQAEYDRLGVPPELKRLLGKLTRSQLAATVNIGTGPFLSNSAQPLNRFLLHSVNKMGLIDDLVSGRVLKGEPGDKGKTRVFLEDGSKIEEREFDGVIIRHGPELRHSPLLTTEQFDEISLHQASTSTPIWDEAFYRRKSTVLRRPLSEQRIAALFGRATPADLASENGASRAAYENLNRRLGSPK